MAVQCVPVGRVVDMEHLMHSKNAVTNGIMERVRILRHEFSSIDLKSILEIGGGSSTDGLKQKSTGMKYYDFIVHFFSTENPPPVTGLKSITLKSCVLLLREHHGQESASVLR